MKQAASDGTLWYVLDYALQDLVDRILCTLIDEVKDSDMRCKCKRLRTHIICFLALCSS